MRIAVAIAFSLMLSGAIRGEIISGESDGVTAFRFTQPERFPPLSFPDYLPIRETALPGNTPVLGVIVGGEARCYPLRQLAYHHIVNDSIGGENVAVTYCVMADSSVVYRRESAPQTFCVGGLQGGVLVLRENESDKLWPQIAVDSQVPGNAKAAPLEKVGTALRTTLEQWKTQHPESLVLADIEEHQLVYEAYDRKPSGFNANLAMNETILSIDHRLPPGERVIGFAAGDHSLAIPVSFVESEGVVTVEFENEKFDLLWIEALGTVELPESENLESIICFWYAWSAFHPQTDIWSVQTP